MNLLKFTELPALKLLLFISVGICSGFFVYWNPFLLFLTFLISLLLGLIFFRLGFLNTVFIIFGITIGLNLSYRLNELQPVNNKKVTPQQPALFTGTVEKILSNDKNYIRLKAAGELDAKTLPPINNTGIILSVISWNNNLHKIRPGNKIQTSVRIHSPQEKLLPGDPDEIRSAVFSENQWFARANANDVSVLQKNENIYSIRDKLLNQINERLNKLFSDDTKGLAIALVTGDQSEIPKETKLSYSLAGTIHVLAVSGLHVGIISVLVLLMTGFFKNRWLKFVIFTICLCFYVYLTGFQPSAIRAGLMAVTSLLLYTIERRINILNVLSFSIIVIIIIEPEMIFSAGFQMSVASIFGIGLFFNPLKNVVDKLFKLKTVITDYLSSSVALSVSASVIVSPIVAYYFGIYSIYSPIANIFVVPLTMLSLIFTLFSLFFSVFFWQLAVVYASAADLLLKLSNKICSLSLDIPFAYLKESHIFLIAFFISISIIYIIFSSNIKLLFLRTVLATLTMLLILNIVNKKAEKDITIIPREKVVFTELKLNNKLTFALVTDRKPTNRPFRDYPLEKYLSEKRDSLTIGIGGLTGMSITDEVKKVKKIRLVELDINSQIRINKLISKSDMFPQMIDISN